MKKHEVEAMLERLREIARKADGHRDEIAERDYGEILATLERESTVNLGEKMIAGIEHGFAHLFGVEKGDPPGGLTWVEYVDRHIGPIPSMLRTDNRGNVL
jgi:hypothetical protein